MDRRRRSWYDQSMESWLLGAKLAIVLFVAVRWVESGSQDGAVVVLLILGYVGLSALIHTVKKRGWNRLLVALNLALTALAAWFFNPLFAFFIPITGAELLYALTKAVRYTPIPALLVITVFPSALLAEYLLCAVFSLLVFAFATRIGIRLDTLTRDNDSLRESNEMQRKRVLAGESYEEQVRRVTQLEERNRLAQEVHDKVGHAIAGTVVQHEAASALLASDPERAGRMMKRSVEVLREGMENIRQALRGIKPQPEELGIQRLRSLLDQFTANSGIRSHLTHSGDMGAITPARWAVIIDNAREALTNVVKHSKASRAAMSIEILARLVKVEIRDDGRGAYSVKKGLGIRGIEERMHGEGGTLIIDGSAGFSMIMLFPRREQSDGG